jgi:hypothetical protein
MLLGGALLFILINITGCATMSVSLNTERGTLDIDGMPRQIKVTSQQEFLIHPVYIRQYLLHDEGREIDFVYEYAVADSGYEFDRGFRYTVDALFDAKTTKLLARGGGYVLLRVSLYDGTVLYVITEEGLHRHLKLIYSGDFDYMAGLYRTIAAEEAVDVKAHDEALSVRKNEVRTRWSYTMLLLKDIVSRINYDYLH